MGMFDLDNKTMLQYILEAEEENYVNSFDESSVAQDPNNFFKDGNVLYRTLPKKESMQDLLTNSFVVVKDRERSIVSQEFYGLFGTLTESIINIKDAGNFTECMLKIANIRKVLGNKMYGALLIEDENILNPLHPLTAIAILDNAHPKVENYRIAIYTYGNDTTRDSWYREMGEDRACRDTIQRNINNQILTTLNKVHTEVKILGEAKSRGQMTIRYTIKKHPEEYENEEHYIVAHQILTHGVVLPYYGTSVIKFDNGQVSGTAITPMKSCNISANYELNPGRYKNKGCDKPQIEWSGVCTGDLQNTSMEGLRTLTHSNASSPHTTYILDPGCLTYADMCIDKSLEIYTQAGFIPSEEVPEPISVSNKKTKKSKIPRTVTKAPTQRKPKAFPTDYDGLRDREARQRETINSMRDNPFGRGGRNG